MYEQFSYGSLTNYTLLNHPTHIFTASITMRHLFFKSKNGEGDKNESIQKYFPDNILAFSTYNKRFGPGY